MKNELKKLGNIIKRNRKLKRISRNKLAEELNVSRQMIYLWEQGESEIGSIKYLMLLEILGLDGEKTKEEIMGKKSNNLLSLEERISRLEQMCLV